MKPDVQSILNHSPETASLPTLFNKINEAVEDPECSFLEIANLIGKDTNLSSHLLKLANSSFFGFPSQIETILHAVTVIGMSQIRDLVLAMTVTEKFKGISGDLIDMKSFWSHSIACGLAARVIATFRHETNVERYYLLGMFHDLGRLMFMLNFPDPVEDILLQVRDGGENPSQLERRNFGCDHAQLGGDLFRKWNLPESLSEAVAYHDHPSDSSRYPLESAVLHIADIITHALRLGFSGDPFVPPLDSGAWKIIDLPMSLLPAIVDQIDRQFLEATQMFLPEE